MSKLNLLLVLLCLGAGAGLAHQVAALSGPDAFEPISSARTVPAEPRQLAVEMPARADIATISARPLFAETRRPVASRPASLSPPPAFDLTGLSRIGDQAIATVQLSGGQSRNFLLGETIEGWRVARIDDGEIELSQGDRRHTVTRRSPVSDPEAMAETRLASAEPRRAVPIRGRAAILARRLSQRSDTRIVDHRELSDYD